MVEAVSPGAEARRSQAGALTRAIAAQVLADVISAGKSLDDTLERRMRGVADAKDRALIQEVSFGVLRILPRLRHVARGLVRRSLEDQDLEVQCLLLVGLYQVSELRVPDHASVSATVGAARVLGKDWATGLLNAVLRRFQRERAALESDRPGGPEEAWCFPLWLLERLQKDWPEQWRTIVEASNARPPLSLRVNALRTTRDAYVQRLASAGMTARPIAHVPQGLVLDRRVPAAELPGFGEGLVSVQDGAAQLAAPLLDAVPGQRVLDVCAAPGGKTAHIAELGGDRLSITAVDRDGSRLGRVAENLSRLGLEAELVQGDATRPEGPWAERRYQRILLDVPCSATGVIRRHPDIKWLRRAADLDALARVQARILEAMWALLERGGVLLYATCSVLGQENERQLERFLARHPDARERSIEAPWGRNRSVGVQILPGDQGMDGFYYARLEKWAA